MNSRARHDIHRGTFDLWELCSSYATKSKKKGEIADVITFCESPWGYGTPLWPCQRFILKCFYGMELDGKNKTIIVPDVFNEKRDTVVTEKEYLQRLYDDGRVNTKDVEGQRFYELILVIGRRGSKSTMATIIAMYEVYKLLKKENPQAAYKVQEGSEVSITSVSTAEHQATKLFGKMLHGVNFSDFLRNKRVGKPSSNAIRLVTEFERGLFGNKAEGTITLSCGGCSAKALRGANNIVVILDEMAFFLDNSSRFSGKAVYDALTPSIASFGEDGKIINISSPGTKTGVFYELYETSFDRPKDALMFKMPSTFVNPTLASRFLRGEYKKNRYSFVSEYGGEFMEKTTGWIRGERVVDACVAKRRETKGKARRRYFMGVDLGLKENGTGIAIVHKEEGQIILDYVQAYYAGLGPFKEAEVLDLDELATLMQQLDIVYPIESGILDQFNGYGLLNSLERKRMKQIRLEQISERMKGEMFGLVMNLLLNRAIELYREPKSPGQLLTNYENPDIFWDPERPGSSLVQEFKNLEQTTTTRGVSRVGKPGGKGFQDDASDAVVRAVWECFHKTAGYDEKASKMERFGRTRGGNGSREGKLARMVRYGMTQRIPPNTRRKLKLPVGRV